MIDTSDPNFPAFLGNLGTFLNDTGVEIDVRKGLRHLEGDIHALPY